MPASPRTPRDTLIDKHDIENTLIDYASACDQRDWSLLAHVFTEDVIAHYGAEFELRGREAVVGMVESMLGGCGPTQHLLGNFVIEVEGDTANCRCYVRAVHAGLDAEADTYYEVWAEYHDQLERSSDAVWRITQRTMHVHKEVGSRAILKPSQEA